MNWDDPAERLALIQRVGVGTPDANGTKSISLARFGYYDVRLLEIVEDPQIPCRMWLELYSHETLRTIDSCRYDVETAVQATEELISEAKRLDDASRRAE